LLAITGSLKTALGARKTTGDLGFQDGIKNRKAELYSSGNTRSRAVLAGTGLNAGEGTGHADNARMIDEGTLESLTIHFPPNSATISSRSLPLVRRVAGMIEELPTGTMVQIDGYTDSTGNPTANMSCLNGAQILWTSP
jgi:outer membrane protein OmpA-like peptidoglycan-associated protein